MKKPIIIGITGGTGSGKSTVTKEIFNAFGGEKIAMIEQDAYYKDQSHLSMEERVLTNYDHPTAFDNKLLASHLRALINGESIEKPQYDFTLHNRTEKTVRVDSKDIIIVEGILILEDKEIRDLLDIKVFVDTDADVRILRRLVRDINERGRTVESVIDQYLSIVRPMHFQFIEPSKNHADIIIPKGGHNKVAIDIIISKVKDILK